jgi:YVTN family beta-propeller protein
MHRHLLGILIVALTLSSLYGAPQAGTSPPVATTPFTDADILRDNIEGNFLVQEVDHIQPLWSRGSLVAALARPTGELVILSIEPWAVLARHQLGLGPNSIVEHPTRQFELWITDTLSNCVTVWDPATLSVKRSIRTAAGPHGIVFDDDGSHAYVACATGRTIDVIDTATFQRIASTPLLVRDPRSIVRDGDRIRVVPFASGNNTIAVSGGTQGVIVSVPDFAAAGAIPLPDEDVLSFQIDPGTGLLTAMPAETATAVGTTLFNAARRPGSQETWVANTEAINDLRGEPSFAAGKVVSNRVTIVNHASSPPTTTAIDLDLAAAGSGIGAAQPRSITFAPTRGQAFVTLEGSDAVGVLSTSGAWLGHFKIAPLSSPLGPIRAMPHGARLVQNRYLVVLCYGTNTVVRIDLDNAVLGSTVTSHRSLGFNPEPDAVRFGRSIINDADRSASQTSSCASCHPSGHTNQTVYDLGDHLHDPSVAPANIELWKDNKGPMVTQSLRGMPEAAPYHWRGERKTIGAFKVAFPGLLKAPPLTNAETEAMEAYVNQLVYPANAHQELDRVTTADQLEGARIFVQELATAGASCNACHALPLGTNGELLEEIAVGPSTSFVVTQLRAVADKEVGDHDLGSTPGPNGPIDFGNCSRIGPALLHDGTIATIFDFNVAFQNIDATEAARLEDFMRAFDTGLAPSTAYQTTVHQGNAATFTEHLDLIALAQKGDCDLVAYGTVDFGGGSLVQANYVYWPPTDTFIPQDGNWPWLTGDTFVALAQAGYGPWTFLGTPEGSGIRKAVDQDGDTLVDLDEAKYGCDPANPDTDGDGFPDGYELRHPPMNPTVPDASSPDNVAPVFDTVEVQWCNTNTARVRVLTTEFCQVTASWAGILSNTTPETRQSPTFGPFEYQHAFTINFLPAGIATTVTFTAVDPAGNPATQTLAVTTKSPQNPTKMFVNDLDISVGPIAISSAGSSFSATATVSLTAQIHSTFGAPLPGATVHGFIYFDDGSGNIVIIDDDATAITDTNGDALITRTLTWTPPGATGTRQLHFGVWDVDSPTAPPPFGYVEALDLESYLAVTF